MATALSVLLLVPINARTAAWTAESAPTDWREQLGRWGRWHQVRTAIVVAALVLLLVGLLG